MSDQCFDETVDGPTAVLESLLAEWHETLAECERLIEEADDIDEKQRQRGRKDAYEYAITWLESRDLEEEPIGAANRLPSRLVMKARDVQELAGAGSVLGPKYTAMRAELDELTVQSRDVQHHVSEEFDESEFDPDAIEWVNDEIRNKLLTAWGYDEHVDDDWEPEADAPE